MRFAAALLLVLTLTACASSAEVRPGEMAGAPPGGGAPVPRGPAGQAAGTLPYDVGPLLKPKNKFVGVALDGVPADVKPLKDYAARSGKQPNLVEFYAAWGHGFDSSGAKRIWDAGALPYLAWEPFEPTIKEIADGKTDDYVRQFAYAVRDLNLPLALSIGHEMNGHWFAWGSKSTKPADFVRAWKHVHDIFVQAGATNVIWVWNPNVIEPVPEVPLAPLFPGDAYVDWVGITGYYTKTGPKDFATLFKPTARQVRTFTKKPLLIAETGAQAGPRKPRDITDLTGSVAADQDFVGFIWFEYNKEADWRATADQAALQAFRQGVAAPAYGFDVRKP
jgi:hypothetical protein